MKKHLFAIVISLVVLTNSMAQSKAIIADSLTDIEKKLEIKVDFVSRYIWRGQSWGGDFPALQPAIDYAISNKWLAGVWATTNFQKEYFYADGFTPNKGYQEIDLGLSYAPKDFLTIQLWDFYWPAFQNMEGVDRDFFNYGPNSVKTVEAALVFDFEAYRYPFNATVSTFVAGNDFRYDQNHENPKQNFTTYVEAGYTFEDILELVSAKTFKNINFSPTIGAVLNNEAQYYSSGDYDQISVVNLAFCATRKFDLGEGLKMPLSLNFTHNAAKKNTEINGRNFVTAMISFNY